MTRSSECHSTRSQGIYPRRLPAHAKPKGHVGDLLAASPSRSPTAWIFYRCPVATCQPNMKTAPARAVSIPVSHVVRWPRDEEAALAADVHQRATFMPWRKENCGHWQSLKGTRNGR